MDFSFLKKYDSTNKQFHFLLPNGDTKIKSVGGGLVSCLQNLLSLFGLVYSIIYVAGKDRVNKSFSLIFDNSFDKTKINFFGPYYSNDIIYLDLNTPNKSDKELELFHKYYRIVYKVTSIKENVNYENITILGDGFSSKSRAQMSNKDFSYPKEEKFPSIEIASCYNLHIKKPIVQNPEMLNNCSTNLTEFYNSSYDFDRNAYWSLSWRTFFVEPLEYGINTLPKNFFLQFKLFENSTDKYNLNYIPVEYSKKPFSFLNLLYKNDFVTESRVNIEELVKVNHLDSEENPDSGSGYNLNVKVLAEPAYPFMLIYEVGYTSIIEALSSLGGFLKIITYVQYLYFFAGYDYDKFHLDLLNKCFQQRKNSEKERETFNKNLGDFEDGLGVTDISGDEINQKPNSIEIRSRRDLKLSNEEEYTNIKEKRKVANIKSRYSLNKTDNEAMSNLLPLSDIKEPIKHGEMTSNDFDFSFCEWLRMKVSVCKCCRLYEKKVRFNKYLGQHLNIENVLRNLKIKEDLSFKKQ